MQGRRADTETKRSKLKHCIQWDSNTISILPVEDDFELGLASIPSGIASNETVCGFFVLYTPLIHIFFFFFLTRGSFLHLQPGSAGDRIDHIIALAQTN